ncbi:MAG: hypothetical protein ACRYG7_45350 [Janthinobacterium lividum]
MNLQHLCAAQCADVYFDKTNNWVFIDWVGELTLNAVQYTCLGIARCFLGHYYPRVLNSNAQVTRVSWDVAQWLASDFLPALTLTGVEQMAWVVPTSLRAHARVLDTVNLFPHVAISLFDDVELAVGWLQQTAPPELATGCVVPGRLHTDELKLQYLVESFAQQLQASSVPA